MFSIRVKELRERAQLSQKAFSDIIQVTQSTYALYELGKREPSLETLCKISDYFKVSVDYLLGREMLYLLPGTNDYENVLNKYGPLGADLHHTFTQMLNSGINIDKVTDVYHAIILLKRCIRNLEEVTKVKIASARDTVKEYGIPLLKEIMLDGSPDKPSENPSNMLYFLSCMSYGIDKAIIAKDELNDLLGKITDEFSSALLVQRFRLAVMKDEEKLEGENETAAQETDE